MQQATHGKTRGRSPRRSVQPAWRRQDARMGIRRKHKDRVRLTSKIDVGWGRTLPESGTGGLPCGSPAVQCQSAWRPLYFVAGRGAYDKASSATSSRETTPRNLTSSSRPSMLPILRFDYVVPPQTRPFPECPEYIETRSFVVSPVEPFSGAGSRHCQTTRVGRNQKNALDCRGNKQTFVHGDCQRQPSTPNGPSAHISRRPRDYCPGMEWVICPFFGYKVTCCWSACGWVAVRSGGVGIANG